MHRIKRALIVLAVFSIVAPVFAQETKAIATATSKPVAKATTTQPTVAKVATVTPSVVVTAAQPAATGQKWWQGLLLIIIEGLIAIIVPILSVLLMGLVRKWNLKIEQDKINWVLDKAVGYGEQYAKNKLKAGQSVTGPEIAKIALEHGTKLATTYAPKLGAYLAELIEAKLGENVVADGGAKAVIADAPK